MKRAAGLVLLWSLVEGPRDVGFLLGGPSDLTQGMLLKLTNGTLATVGLWHGWRVGYACLVGWCLQGALMSIGEWQGQGANLSSALSLGVRSLLLGWFVRERILRKETPAK